MLGYLDQRGVAVDFDVDRGIAQMLGVHSITLRERTVECKADSDLAGMVANFETSAVNSIRLRHITAFKMSVSPMFTALQLRKFVDASKSDPLALVGGFVSCLSRNVLEPLFNVTNHHGQFVDHSALLLGSPNMTAALQDLMERLGAIPRFCSDRRHRVPFVRRSMVTSCWLGKLSLSFERVMAVTDELTTSAGLSE